MTKLEQIRNLDDGTLIDIVSGNLCVTKSGKLIPCQVNGVDTDCSDCIFTVNGKSCTEICKRWLKDEHEKIKVGDIVYIIDKGKLYTTYADWVAINIDRKYLIAKYAYGHSDVTPADLYKVLEIADNGYGTDNLAYITRTLRTSKGDYDFECYLISVTGLKKVGE